MAERDSIVQFADVDTGNSFIDGTNGFVRALVVCCGAGTTFAGSDFLFCIVLVLSSLLLALIVLYLLPLFVWWLWMWLLELMVCMKQAVSPLPVRSMWPMRLPVVWEMASCCVVCCDDGAVFAFFSASILFGQSVVFYTLVAWVCLVCLPLCNEESSSPMSLQLLR